ncbi:hypothetical protein CSB95_6361 [Pseudomonas aeruginosa]|uniref:Uncharacterized protein n=1 Tax=Pseudomonas aeruginosa TaxID=287 RepID=A0A241XNI2_PSEAI|nr:hypothetical protein CGU46_06505 [Pseudomonas aeruginosa]KUI87428.1 hypothetical protein ASV59_22095 [Pseudomonas aeruginosa 0C2E]ASP13567.1 hypothetical protein CGU45_20315 [Pseudomonas aeruginosa]AWE83127.1 hypothetical protein CSC29_6620 [Pseudomonas aeruginosa]AWR45948.1 hypothetical protein CLH63_25450 [Pseudomonas aeruginosa]
MVRTLTILVIFIFNYLKSINYKLKQPFENNLAQSMISI